MKLKNSINFFKYFKNIINLELRKFYLNTSYYDSKISKLDTKNLIYRPNLSTFDSIIKYDKEKINIDITDNYATLLSKIISLASKALVSKIEEVYKKKNGLNEIFKFLKSFK